ncbi:transcriptional regulator [Comamonas testosteroni]|uniref:Transcriptional regulator n=1 Tax=Comamonas testosteroni TaxID=285 RepID=A0A5A7MCJ1_COMTE|nr:IclR family transcriptional regulator [Comamonas testosteroni]GEQ75250.1 transcriptional regulator [Comamonas testosteroni]
MSGSSISDSATDSVVDGGSDKYMVPALERGLRLLQEFGRDNATLGAPELARRLQLPRATVFRMLNTLESMGFLQRAEGGNDYRLGLSVLRLGFEFLSSMDLTELGQPVIARLCEEIRFPCNIVVRDGRSIVYVAKVTPPTPLTSSVRVGTRLPAHATLLGRILLADLSLPELRALYPEEQLEGHSPNTPRTVIDLFDLVQSDRERGHVAGAGFYESSISTIAAPVRDHSGRVIAALGVTLASAQIDLARQTELVPRVCAAAAELSELLNYRPQSSAQVLSITSRRAGGGHA